MLKNEGVQVKFGRILFHFFAFASLWASVVMLGEFYLVVADPLTMMKKVCVAAAEVCFPLVHLFILLVKISSQNFSKARCETIFY